MKTRIGAARKPYIAVLGAGTMGGGLAELFVKHGFDVSLYDPDPAALAKVRTRLSAADLNCGERSGPSALLGQSVSGDQAEPDEGGEMNRTSPRSSDTLRTTGHFAEPDGSGDSNSAVCHAEERNVSDPSPRHRGTLRTTGHLEAAVRPADFVLEAGPELLPIKRELYAALIPALGADAIVASNTSSLPLRSLADGLPYADRFVIAHFFHPAAIIPLVEIVGLPDTRPGVVGQVAEWLAQCGKSPVVLRKDCPGFIANRLQAAVLREACHLLAEGIADAEQIDRAMTEGPGLRWALNGPFAISDLGGLDIWERVADNLFPQLSAAPDVPQELSGRVREGRVGTKSGAGFYNYGDTEAREQAAAGRERTLRTLIANKKEMSRP
ncbi:3-hydroxyacyl-CoA dehydrogenase family protein [Paenibacillus hodogayensis]|uniref:3-hydroxyacyl-CoA dehydrogenase family protein n=1 Tax=Paenibacillus hodogayensis TaxID=279208 RepID=A0ABV5VYQ7_9BACL